MEASGDSMFEMPVTGLQLGTAPNEARRGQNAWATDCELNDEKLPPSL